MQTSLPSPEALQLEFPATKGCIYMDVANQGLISRTTRTAIDPHLDNRLFGRNDEAAMLQHVEHTRAQFAAMIGAANDEIAVTKNASEGINIIANAMDWRPGDNIILCPTLEHANNVLPWLRIAARHAVEIRALKPDRGHVPTEAIAKAVNSRTRLVSLSTVTMVPGFRTSIGPIADACRRFDSFLLADATQSVGVLHTDVQQLGLDGLAVSTVKGLMGLYGSGFLYCRRSWANRLSPVYIARFSVDLGISPESAPVSSEPNLRAGALRFEIGHYNFPGLVAAYSSMRQLMEIGTVAIESKVTSLAAHLASGLLQLGLPVCGGLPGAHIGSIVSLGDVIALGQAPVPDERLASLHEYLTRHDVIVSIRRGLLRFSLHFYNTEDQVDCAIDLVKKWCSMHPRWSVRR